jgi:hypothetical protein
MDKVLLKNIIELLLVFVILIVISYLSFRKAKGKTKKMAILIMDVGALFFLFSFIAENTNLMLSLIAIGSLISGVSFFYFYKTATTIYKIYYIISIFVFVSIALFIIYNLMNHKY